MKFDFGERKWMIEPSPHPYDGPKNRKESREEQHKQRCKAHNAKKGKRLSKTRK